jgi:hypothetical protein
LFVFVFALIAHVLLHSSRIHFLLKLGENRRRLGWSIFEGSFAEGSFTADLTVHWQAAPLAHLWLLSSLAQVQQLNHRLWSEAPVDDVILMTFDGCLI